MTSTLSAAALGSRRMRTAVIGLSSKNPAEKTSNNNEEPWLAEFNPEFMSMLRLRSDRHEFLGRYVDNLTNYSISYWT